MLELIAETECLGLYQPRFLLGIGKHRASLKNPPMTEEEYLASLRTQGLHRTAQRLETHPNAI